MIYTAPESDFEIWVIRHLVRPSCVECCIVNLTTPAIYCVVNVVNNRCITI